MPNLVNAGHTLSVWNRSLDAAKALNGVAVLNAPAGGFGNDAVITMLSNDEAVRSAILNSGALTSARKDCIPVMMATISPALAAAARHRAGLKE